MGKLVLVLVPEGKLVETVGVVLPGGILVLVGDVNILVGHMQVEEVEGRGVVAVGHDHMHTNIQEGHYGHMQEVQLKKRQHNTLGKDGVCEVFKL